MLSEFERRVLNVVQNSLDLTTVIASLGQNAFVDYYAYTLGLGSAVNPLVKGVTQSGVISIQSDAYFVLHYISVGVNIPDNSAGLFTNVLTLATDINLQVTDTGSGHELFNQAIPAGLVCGSAQISGSGIPYLYSIPRIVPPNTNLKIDVTQLGSDPVFNPQPNRFWVVMNGAKVTLM